MTKSIFTLPLATTGNYLFALSEAEQLLSPDDWAWLFLRINPLYRHDYDLIRGAGSATSRKIKKKFRPGNLLYLPALISDPSTYTVTDGGPSRSTPRTVDELDTELLGMDSRYFCLGKIPISGTLDGLIYSPTTLGSYISRNDFQTVIRTLSLRDFEASRDYGIATWVNPDRQKLEEISGGSWFYLSQEPLWQANTWAVSPPEPIYSTLRSGEKIIVGGTEKTTFEVTVEGGENLTSAERQQLNLRKAVPPINPSRSSTELDFLICLDGYVEPQLNRVKVIAEQLKGIHKTYDKTSVARGTLTSYQPEIFDPEAPSLNEVRVPAGMYSSMARDSNYIRKNWRQVHIDVAAPLDTVFKILHETLKSEQLALGDQLTFPIRKRAFRLAEKGDNSLKKALCIVELHLMGGLHTGDKTNSQQTITNALYDPGNPYYQRIRGVAGKTSSASSSVLPTRYQEIESHLVGVRRALETGRDIVLGWYEHLINMDFDALA